MKPKFFFDYIYYRITKTYFKWDGRTGTTAIAAITMMQVLTLLDLIVITTRLVIGKTATPYAKPISYLFVVALLGLFAFNFWKYNGRYNQLKGFWKEESDQLKSVRGTLVVLCIILPWLPIILISIFW